MAKKVSGQIKLQIPAGEASPARPGGTARTRLQAVRSSIELLNGGFLVVPCQPSTAL